MASAPKPKIFVAVRDFRVRGEQFSAGQEVAGLHLQAALEVGGFVEPKRANTQAPAENKE